MSTFLEENTLQATVDWFDQAVPEPTNRTVQVQLGVHLEEFAELLSEIHFKADMVDLNSKFNKILGDIRLVADYLKQFGKSKDMVSFPNRTGTLDAICDGLVTAAGLAHMLGMDPVAGLNEVNRSNFSKFTDGKPVFDHQGKISKGPDYSEPDLKPFV